MKYVVWIMRCIGAVVLVMVASCTGWVGWLGWREASYKDIVYAYRLTVKAEMAGRTYAGSSVTEVRWEHRSKWTCWPDTCSEWSVASIRAEALVVNMGKNGLVLVTLGQSAAGPDTVSLPANIFHEPGSDFLETEAGLKRLAGLTGTRAVRLDWLPKTFFFPDPDNPADAACANLPEPFWVRGGPAPVLTKATLQMVQEPPTAEAGRALPWLKSPEPVVKSRLDTIKKALRDKYQLPYCDFDADQLKSGM